MEIPADISESAWDMARHVLSDGFTIPIANRLEEVIALAKDIDALQAYDFKFVTWERFTDPSVIKPEGLLERAKEWRGETTDEPYVVFDPLDDANGFLYLSIDGAEAVRISCEYIMQSEPETGPLSLDNLVKFMVETA